MQFDKAKTDDEIDALLDRPSSMSIWSNSRWSILATINKLNKDAFLQQLIIEEVIIRREANLQAFHHGMSVLGITGLIEDHPHLMKPLFVAQTTTLTASIFCSLFSSTRLGISDQAEMQAYDMFMEFIVHTEGNYVQV